MTTQPLTDHQLDEIEARAAALNTLGLPGGTWTASPRDEKSVLPPEMAHVVEDVLRTKHSLLRSSVGVFGDERHAEFIAHAREDVSALLAEVRRLRDRVAELEAYAYGCDAEGCVLPHSSWCEAAQKTAAANNGCTCGKPWTGHPQPHAMHCWTVNPPRAEVEEMRKRIAELTATQPAV